MLRSLLFSLVCLLASPVAAKTFTFEESLGEFVLSAFDHGLLVGQTRAELRQSWDSQLNPSARLRSSGSSFLDAVERDAGVRDFDSYYDILLTRAMNFVDTSFLWRADGVAVESNSHAYFSQCARLDCSGLGKLAIGDDSVLPRQVTMHFDTPELLYSLDVSIDAPLWHPGGYLLLNAITADGKNIVMQSGLNALNTGKVYFSNAFRHVVKLELAVFGTATSGDRTHNRVQYSSLTTMAPVPLPASFSLLMAGLGGIVLMRRRRVSLPR